MAIKTINFIQVLGLTTIILMSTITSIPLKSTPSSSGNEDVFELGNENAQSLNATVGKVFIVNIRGNPTTGYGWYLDNRSNLDTNMIQPLNLNKYDSTDDFVTDDHPEGYVGVGGVYSFKFSGLKTGAVDLIFVNKRPWEHNTPPFKTVTLTVNLS